MLTSTLVGNGYETTAEVRRSEEGEPGGGEGFLALSHPAWVSLPPAPVSSVCELYSVYCAVLWRVAHHGNYHGEERDSGTSVRAGRGNMRDIVSVISHDTHNTRLLWELRRGNY